MRKKNVRYCWFQSMYVIGRESGTGWRNHIFEYFSHWKWQDLVENFECAAGFPRTVIVFTSELEQAACWDVQDSQGMPSISGQTFEMLIQSSAHEIRLLMNSSWLPISCHGTYRGESCAWVCGQFVPLSIISHTWGHEISSWENRRESVIPPRLLGNKAREHNTTLSSRITLCLPEDPSWFVSQPQ